MFLSIRYDTVNFQKHRLTNPDFLKLYNNVLKSDGIVHLKTDSEFLHGYTLGLLEGMCIKPLNSNHDIYKNRNAPDEAVNIQTYYESIYLKDDKKISYLSFNFNEQ